jgi:hypothetical protein
MFAKETEYIHGNAKKSSPKTKKVLNKAEHIHHNLERVPGKLKKYLRRQNTFTRV